MESRREQIIAAARAVFADAGPAGMSVRAVAERAGVGASTLRHYFPTQRELRDAVFVAAFDEVVDDLRIRDREVPPRERLTECVRQFLAPSSGSLDDSLQEWFEMISLVMRSDASSSQRLLWSAVVRRGFERLVTWLEVLRAEGALRPGDTTRQARLLLAVADGLALGMVMPGEHLTPEQAFEALDDVVAAVVS